MPVFGYVATGGNGMNIHVENSGVFTIDNQLKGSKAGFFPRFAKGHGGYVGVAVSVTTGLKPSAEFAVMNQDCPLTVRTHNPG